jgi:opacity protein-like surface antigen
MRRLLAAATLAAATLLSAGPTAAAEPPGQAGAFNMRFGGFFPGGGGDFWSNNENKFTLDHSDFNGLMGGVGYTASITNYFEVDVDADFYASSNTSANRSISDSFGFPILHDTRLAMFPLTVGFRVLPAGRYTRRGSEGKHFVRRPVPYLGAGIGGSYWQYEEEGDFVYDDPTVPEGQSIFYDRMKNSGFAFEKHVMVGMEFPVSPEWNITFEVRESWAEATPGSAFPSQVSNPILSIPGGTLDLGGTIVTVGGSLRF